MLVPRYPCETHQRWQHDAVMLLPCVAITLADFIVYAPSFYWQEKPLFAGHININLTFKGLLRRARRAARTHGRSHLNVERTFCPSAAKPH